MRQAFRNRLPLIRSRTTSTTVRYVFSTALVASLFAGLAAVISGGSSYVSIVTTPSSVKEGDNIMIEVLATAHTPVNAIDITLAYQTSKLKIEGIDTGTSVITLWTKEPYAENGSIYLSGGTFRKGFVGEHTIARIRARALASGTAYVTTNNVAFVAGDGLGTTVEVDDTDSDEARILIATADGTLVGEVEMTIVTDVDGDGAVDLKDISAFMAAWFTKGKLFDFNGDGRMTFKDFSILLADSFFK